MSESEFFTHIPQREIPWRDKSIKIPTFYYDAMAVEAGFLAAAERVKSFLPSPRMHPYRITPRRCLVAIAGLKYTDSDVGPYNEVLIGIPFTLDKPSPMFSGSLRRLPEMPMVYVHRLPVTTEIAHDAGIEFLGAPKFMADITFEDSGDWVSCRLVEKGGEWILTLSVRKGNLTQAGRTYSRMINKVEGYLLRFDFIESAQQKSLSQAARDVQLELGTHTLADDLRHMDLGRPLYMEYRPQFKALLTPVVESFKS